MPPFGAFFFGEYFSTTSSGIQFLWHGFVQCVIRLKILTVRKIFKVYKMSKFTFSFNEKSVVITDGKNNSESIELLDKLDTIESLRAIGKEQNASIKASVGALSLLAEMLSDARFDFYKGITPINEKIPKEFNSALRDKISEYMKPAFIADQIAKGAKPATADNQWQIYASGLNTGSFSNAKTWAVKFYCQLGKLPTLDNGKLLPLRAIIKMLEDAKLPATDTGIAGKLADLRDKVNNRNTEEGADDGLGDYALAVACLKDMLATYTGLLSAQNEMLTQLHSDGVIALSQGLISKAQGAIQIADDTEREKSLEQLEQEFTLQYEQGTITEQKFLELMKEIGVDVVFETSPM